MKNTYFFHIGLQKVKFILTFVFFSTFLCSVCHAQGQNLRIESSFQPPSITISNNSVYKVIIYGSQENPQGALPQVDALIISNSPQTFRSASFINGVPSVRLEMSFQVKPKKMGKHTIPSWPLKIGLKTLQVPACTLEVLSPNQQDKIRQVAEEKQKADLKQACFIEFTNPRSFLFEGETVSGLINLYIWDRLPVSRIERAPQKDGDAFSLTELGQPQEKRNQTKYNKLYSVFSWPIGLTAAIAGKHQVVFNTAVRVRVKSRGNSPFGSPFFNDPFFGFGREESLNVTSEPQSIEVKSLPTSGRPDSFQGAIGAFSTRSIVDNDRVSLGDPVRLFFEIEGQGNFAAMPAPNFESNSNFKIGPPAFSFEGNELTKHQGNQRFEYILTPLTPGLLKIPAVSFSYFDPGKEKYFISNSQEHPLRVDPGETWIDTTNEDNQIEKETFSIPTTDLFQTENEPGEWVKKIQNKTLLDSPVFWATQCIPFLCVCGLIFYGRKRKRTGRDIFRQKQSALKKQMKEAIEYKDSTLFYRATRERLRLEIGTFYKHPNPSSLSSNELTTLLKRGLNEDSVISQIQEILHISDSYEFAETENERQSLDSLFRKINNLLKKIR
ncbi:MAG: BatD family protein [Flavobacteriaceae bacterium]|nr:BatD family protein [Flavobacteriaceae bacterium]